jgi:type 1 glutamine amidotransferase
MNTRNVRSSFWIFSVLATFSLANARAADTVVYEGKSGPGRGKHIVLISGDEEYRSEEGLPMLARLLSQRHGFKCTVLFSLDPDGAINPDNQRSLPGAEALDSADAIILQTRFRDWPDAQMKHFIDAYRRGVPIVGLRTATHAFQVKQGTYKEMSSWGKRVLGEGWVNHWGNHTKQATRAILEPGAKESPVMNGVDDIFTTTDVYEAYPAADVKILVRGQALAGMTPDSPPADNIKVRASDKKQQPVNDPMMPIAWTRIYKNEAGKENRILCTTIGAATDLKNEGLRRMVVNGVYWGLGMEVPAKADVTIDGDYQPNNYGFKGYRKGLKPDDFVIREK